jgi:hypothetical protein
MELNNYYNAKPSQITNLGQDVSGARRMNYDTYENPDVKKAKAIKAKNIKDLKSDIKASILSDNCDIVGLIILLKKQFFLDYNLDFNDYKYDLDQLRCNAVTSEQINSFNKTVRALNKLKTQIRSLEYYQQREVNRLKKRYDKKESIREFNGQKCDWKTFKANDSYKYSMQFFADNAHAVQFGNSVTDNERAFILQELQAFINQWKENTQLRNIELNTLSWSFGARGNAQSVAYYSPSLNLVSVNRNNIGSIIHEVGHYLDYHNKLISNYIKPEFIADYRNKLKSQGMTGSLLKYYSSRKEIFARAFEAFVYSINANFSTFAQCGGDYLPELDSHMIELMQKALGNLDY